MPTTISTFTAAETTMRFRETYVTEGLNRKGMAYTRGIYRGFRLAPEVGDRQIKVVADATTTDHLAVYHTGVGTSGGGYSLTVRKAGGDITPLSLTAYSSTTVIIALYVIYTVGGTTSAVIRAYTVAEFQAAAELAELVVLGTVGVPVSGTIAASAVSQFLRVSAWEHVPPEVQPPVNLLSNPDFELGSTALVSSTTVFQQPIPYWSLNPSVNLTMRRSTSVARSGLSSVVFNVTLASASVTATLGQTCGVPLDKTKQRIRGRLYFKRLVAVTVSTGITVSAVVTTSAGAVTTVPLTIAATPLVGAADTSYQVVEWDADLSTMAVGVGTGFVSLIITLGATTFGASVTDVLSIDAVELYAPSSLNASRDPARFAPILTNGMVLRSADYYQPDLGLLAGTGAAIFRGLVTGEVDLRMETLADGFNLATNVLRWLFEGQIRLGQALADGAGSSTFEPLLLVPVHSTVGTRVLMYQTNATGANPRVRFYINGVGLYYLTYNARWDGTNWNKDDTALFSLMLSVDGIYKRLPGAGAWADASWLFALRINVGAAVTTANTSNVYDGENAILRIQNAATGAFVGDSNIAATTAPSANSLYAKNIVKAWARILIVAGVPTLQDGFNIASVATSATSVTVVMALAMDSDNHSVVVSGGALAAPALDTWGLFAATINTTLEFRGMRLTPPAGVVSIIPNANSSELHFVVMSKDS